MLSPIMVLLDIFLLVAPVWGNYERVEETRNACVRKSARGMAKTGVAINWFLAEGCHLFVRPHYVEGYGTGNLFSFVLFFVY